MAQITGRVRVSVNGALVRSKSGAKFSGIGGVNRKAVKGHQMWGFAEETAEPKIEATLAHTKDLSLTALNQIVDATVTFECDTGATYILRHAWCEAAPDLAEGRGM